MTKTNVSTMTLSHCKVCVLYRITHCVSRAVYKVFLKTVSIPHCHKYSSGEPLGRWGAVWILELIPTSKAMRGQEDNFPLASRLVVHFA